MLLGSGETSWRDSISGTLVASVAVHADEADHLFHDAGGDMLFHSHGANRQAGGIVRIDPAATRSYGGPAVTAITTLIDADATERIVMADGQWIVANDAFFTTALRRSTGCCTIQRHDERRVIHDLGKMVGRQTSIRCNSAWQ